MNDAAKIASRISILKKINVKLDKFHELAGSVGEKYGLVSNAKSDLPKFSKILFHAKELENLISMLED